MYLSVLQVAFQNIFECFSFLCTCQQFFVVIHISIVYLLLYLSCYACYILFVGEVNFRTCSSYWMKLFQFSSDQFFGYKNFNLIIGVKIWLLTVFLNHGTGPCYSYISLFGPSGTPSVGIQLTHSRLRKCSNINSYMQHHVQPPMYTRAFTMCVPKQLLGIYWKCTLAYCRLTLIHVPRTHAQFNQCSS